MGTNTKALKKVDLIFPEWDIEPVLDTIKKMNPADIIAEIQESGLRGRGGAGFPTGLKWDGAAKADGAQKYVICNADEGEPGTFKDRQILQDRPEKILLGMTACARAIGASKAFIYLRGEYNYLLPELKKRIASFQDLLKKRSIDLDIEIRSGSGAYVCGEETSLIESMEGKRGEPRNKPPFPARHGYLNMPTVVNNVETLVYAAVILKDGAKAFRSIGTEDSRGAKVFSVSGDASQQGIFELELGMLLEDFVEQYGDGHTKAVQVGGSSGHCVPRKDFGNTVIGFEGIPTGGSMMLFNSSRSMYHILHNYLDFFEEESCGQCVPCRVGTQQLLKGIEAVKKGEKPAEYLDELIKLAKSMGISAKCGLGQSVANPFISIVENFREEILF